MDDLAVVLEDVDFLHTVDGAECQLLQNTAELLVIYGNMNKDKLTQTNCVGMNISTTMSSYCTNNTQ